MTYCTKLHGTILYYILGTVIDNIYNIGYYDTFLHHGISMNTFTRTLLRHFLTTYHIMVHLYDILEYSTFFMTTTVLTLYTTAHLTSWYTTEHVSQHTTLHSMLHIILQILSFLMKYYSIFFKKYDAKHFFIKLNYHIFLQHTILRHNFNDIL